MMKFSRVYELIKLFGAVISVTWLVFVVFGWPGNTLVSIILNLGIALIGFILGSYSNEIVAVVRRLPQAKRVFLSYSQDDKQKADTIAKLLRAAGVRVWMADEQIMPGDKWMKEVEIAIQNADSLMVLVPSIPSPLIKSEITSAIDKKKKIIPVVPRNINVDEELFLNYPILSSFSAIQFSDDDTDAISKLIEAST